MGHKTSIALFCHSRLFRDSLLTLLNGEKDLCVTASQSLFEVGEALANPPNVLVIQYHPEYGEALKQIVKSVPQAKSIIVDADPKHMDVVACVQLSVAGFVLEDAGFEDLANSIRAVDVGSRVLPESVVARLYAQVHESGNWTSRDLARSMVELTIRERQIVELVVEGLGNKEIAERLSISTYTVKSHVHNILEKLKIPGRLDLVNYVWKRGGSAFSGL